MDIYGLHNAAPDGFPIDDLLDFSNDDLFSSSSASNTCTTPADFNHHHHHFLQPENPFGSSSNIPTYHFSTDFTHDLCVPNDDVAQLEWLSQFVDESFSNFPLTNVVGVNALGPDTSSFSVQPRTNHSRATSAVAAFFPDPESSSPRKPKCKRETTGKNVLLSSPSSPANNRDGVRRCSHCASEKTPQWRAGPLGPKTLCNACGVRYKSGRLVPEYRPAASPTFVLTQHSNSHRKVLELRRQKELLRQQQQHPHNFQVC